MWAVTIHGVLSNSDFSSCVELVLNWYTISLHEPIHPIVGRHVFIAQFWTEIVISQSTYERTYWHGLTDGLEVHGIGIESQNGTTRLLASYPGLTGAGVTGEDDAGSAYDVSFDYLVEVLVLFVKQSEVWRSVSWPS